MNKESQRGFKGLLENMLKPKGIQKLSFFFIKSINEVEEKSKKIEEFSMYSEKLKAERDSLNNQVYK